MGRLNSHFRLVSSLNRPFPSLLVVDDLRKEHRRDLSIGKHVTAPTALPPSRRETRLPAVGPSVRRASRLGPISCQGRVGVPIPRGWYTVPLKVLIHFQPKVSRRTKNHSFITTK